MNKIIDQRLYLRDSKSIDIEYQPLEEGIKRIRELHDDLIARGWIELTFNIVGNGDDYAYLLLQGYRLRTPQELEYYDNMVKRGEESERATFEALKKKYESQGDS